ncbi:S-layer homology domain-containing protein [Salsuginibacillus kocurii]|uniref:S-layer homology domain-containing protein n=1 Tax=Salsuginibacillus kocurii TaxID=427078 RepID=UPI0003763C05|nr:S-layer homology domain-containing protein [Salsuginibacillus kocurii]
MKNYLLGVAGVAAMLLVSSPLQAAEDFTDLTQGDDFYSDIQVLAEKGIVSGLPDGSFGADQSLSRGEAAIMVSRALDLNTEGASHNFEDVPSSGEVAEAIGAAVDANILDGFPDGSFRPDEAMTREQMAIILSQSYDLVPAAHFMSHAHDVERQRHSFEEISELYRSNVTSGYPDGTFQPENEITRGEFSAFLHRAMNAEIDPPVEELNDPIVFVKQAENILFEGILEGYQDGYGHIGEEDDGKTAFSTLRPSFSPYYSHDYLDNIEQRYYNDEFWWNHLMYDFPTQMPYESITVSEGENEVEVIFAVEASPEGPITHGAYNAYYHLEKVDGTWLIVDHVQD